MKSSFSLTVMLTAIALIAFSQLAYGGKGDKGGKGKKAELVNLDLSGTVGSKQVEKKGKDGDTRTYTVYYLETDSEKIHLPQPHSKKKGESPSIQLADFVGAKVKVSAKGLIRSSKKGGPSTYVHQVVSIERVET